MKLNQDNQTLAEGKILILYTLNQLNKPITNLELLKLILNIKEINYFYLQQFLLDLVNLNYIATYEDDNHWLYEITNEGKNILELTQDLLPGITKQKVDTSVNAILDNIQDKVSVSAEYSVESKNSFNVKCKIIESRSNLIEVSVLAGSKEQAKLIAENWKKNSLIIYPKIIDLLTQEIPDENSTTQD